MKTLHVSALIAFVGLLQPLDPAAAQSSISPASPSNTSANLFSRPTSAAATPPPAAMAVRGSNFDGLMGAYPPAGMGYGYGNPGGGELVDPNHKLGRNDRLSYRVVEDRDDKVTPLVVTDSGEVDVPLVGRVKAVGKSTGQLTADIKSALEREYYYHATVLLGLDTVAARVSPGVVYVTGAVRTVGSVELPVDGQMTASQAIYKQGGPVDFSNLKRTRVLRKGGPKEGIPVNVKAVESGELDKDVVLKPGDTVIVPQTGVQLRF